MRQPDDIVISLDTIKRTNSATTAGIAAAITALQALEASIVPGIQQSDADTINAAIEEQCTALAALSTAVAALSTDLRVNRSAGTSQF